MIEIDDSCSDPMGWFGLDEWTVRTTVTAADTEHLIDMIGGQPLTVGFYEKDHGDRRVVAIRLQGVGRDVIVNVFVVPPAIATHSSPLDTVKATSARYGIPLQAGGTEVTFLLQTEVPAPGPIVQHTMPKDRHCLAQMLMMPTARSTVYVALAFNLEATKMLKDIG